MSSTEKVREWRRKNPESMHQQNEQARRRNRALAALRDRHPEEYDALYREVVLGELAERARRGQVTAR